MMEGDRRSDQFAYSVVVTVMNVGRQAKGEGAGEFNNVCLPGSGSSRGRPKQ